ncbi:putative T7SS-secreted protein [Streptomyces sp. HC307]|uniref:putative T7SS-secreted protein n=1 Tax=Streptomyces flavusporus TaxID=3385496 RepID=UPI00391756C0
MGIGDFVSDITPDVVEDAVEDGAEWVGNRVEDAGNWTADRLQDVGWESGADWVREQSRSLANRMGAEVDEMDLGQTEDKTKLIHGSPGKLRSTASHLRDFTDSFNDVGLGLEGLDSDSLQGQAADAFRRTVKLEPPKWYKGADAFEGAAKALESFADTVTWGRARRSSRSTSGRKARRPRRTPWTRTTRRSTTTTTPSTSTTRRPPTSVTPPHCRRSRASSPTPARRRCRRRRTSSPRRAGSGTPPPRPPVKPCRRPGTRPHPSLPTANS